MTLYQRQFFICRIYHVYKTSMRRYKRDSIWKYGTIIDEISTKKTHSVYDITRKITRNDVRPPPKTGVLGGFCPLDFRQFSSNDLEKKI